MKPKVYLETTIPSYLTAWPSSNVLRLALQQRIPLPSLAAVDALHIAIAVLNGIEYLLTWNCTHIANATFRDRIDSICQSFGYKAPTICTPEELRSGDSPYFEDLEDG